jgi:hypothetical protein
LRPERGRHLDARDLPWYSLVHALHPILHALYPIPRDVIVSFQHAAHCIRHDFVVSFLHAAYHFHKLGVVSFLHAVYPFHKFVVVSFLYAAYHFHKFIAFRSRGAFSISMSRLGGRSACHVPWYESLVISLAVCSSERPSM